MSLSSKSFPYTNRTLASKSVSSPVLHIWTGRQNAGYEKLNNQ